METTQQTMQKSGVSGGNGHDKDVQMTPSREAMTSAFKKIICDAEELLTATKNYSAEGLADARDRLQVKLEETKARVSEAGSVIKEKADKATVATEKYVITNPWQSLALATSLGLLVGLLLRKRG